jgi:hypothetical protein
MDYGISDDERRVIDWVASTVERWGGLDRLRRSAADLETVAELDAALTGPTALGAPLRHRALIVEETARLGLPACPGTTLLIAQEVLDPAVTDLVAVADLDRPGPIRLPGSSRFLLTFDRNEVRLAEIQPSGVARVASSFGYPYATIADPPGETLPGVDPSRVRALRHLCLATELAGTARAAIEHAASYLDSRQQFGQSLSTFQALRHRLADLAVSAEAAMWLAREAAGTGDPARAGTAAMYARNLAAKMAPEMVQLSGARGFTLEFPLHLFAMRAEAIRLELGSGHRVAGEIWDAGPGSGPAAECS